MRSFDRSERAFSLVEVMIALTIVLVAGSLAATSFKGCATTHKKIVAGEAMESEVSLLVTKIEKQFIHATTTSMASRKGRFHTGFTLRRSDGVTNTYQSQCRPGAPTALAMAQWKGECFKAMACPGGSTAVVHASASEQYPSASSKGFAYVLCAEDVGGGVIRLVVEAATKVDEQQQEPRIVTKEKLLTRNAALGNEIQLLPKP